MGAGFHGGFGETNGEREHVAGLKANRHAPDGKKLCGTYKGVRVVVIKTHGKIATVFPDSVQPTRRNKK